MKRCYFCKGEIISKKINHVHSWKDKLVLFNETPADVCKQCGEIYLKPDVVRVFDKVTAHLEKVKETICIPVVPFAQTVKA